MWSARLKQHTIYSAWSQPQDRQRYKVS